MKRFSMINTIIRNNKFKRNKLQQTIKIVIRTKLHILEHFQRTKVSIFLYEYMILFALRVLNLFGMEAVCLKVWTNVESCTISWLVIHKNQSGVVHNVLLCEKDLLSLNFTDFRSPTKKKVCIINCVTVINRGVSFHIVV